MARRDRHGRGLRAPLLPTSVPGYRSPSEVFDDHVLAAAEMLEERWASRWGRLEFGIENVPPSPATPWEDGVPLGRLFPADAGQAARIVLYRRPIEQRAVREDLAYLVRDIVIENVAHVVGRRPEDVHPSYGTGM